ncbi:UpxY family transcription antiterminator [Puia sp.]|jgi:transcription antitermination factor NusG|uniref:UpxY family transcription antiterminator n=1 Tax=Puia sp. TaxID=2045100 RepID=UPI002F422F5F
MSNFFQGWYLIYTRPRHERKVFAQLTEMKVRSFLPTTKKLRIWHDRKKFIEEPLFPSYVFVYLQDRYNYQESIDADGFLYFVKTGKEIARVPESVISNIELLSKDGSEIEVSTASFLPGQKLVINQGALTGLSCEVVQFNGKQKLLVRVDLLQRNLLVTLPVDHLMAI